jgi:hypothetical protein
MKTLFISLFLASLALPCFSQRSPMGGRPQGNPPPVATKSPKMKRYNVNKEETVNAIAGDIVVSIQNKTNMLCLSATTSDGKTWTVLLGESGITRENLPRIANGQEITITGIKNEHRKKGNTIRPREIVVGDSTLVLLDKDGRPIHLPNMGQGGRPPMSSQGGPGGRGGGPPRRR